MMALKRNASNTAASRLGAVLAADRSGNTVIKWEICCEAALVASMKAWYMAMQLQLNSGADSNVHILDSREHRVPRSAALF